jgi:hypothetical protein
MRKLLTTVAAVAAVPVLALFAATAASASPALNVSFFQGGAGSAHWLPGHSAIQLSVPDNSSYAGADLHHVISTLPDAPPSFTYTEAGTINGGAPRLIIAMANGDNIEVVDYTAADGADNGANSYDVYGGPSGYHYNASWADVQTLEGDNAVSDVYLVSDAYQGGHTDTITQLQFNDTHYLG